MNLRILETGLHVLNMRTRMPFRYGIATLTALPHLMVRLMVEIDGRAWQGLAADGLPPRWFTKDPDAEFRDELEDMLAVIRTACDCAAEVGTAGGVFDLWQEVYSAQEAWAAGTSYPPLLWSFGVSLVERALIDAFCRATGVSFAHAVQTNTLGVRPQAIHPELAGRRPGDLLSVRPLGSIIARHTVGLTDPLTDDDIPVDELIDDGLPQSLEGCICAYELTHFKIKLWGERERDLERLRQIARIIEANTVADYAFTLDGNEQFRQVEPFRELWQALLEEAALARFMDHLLLVEQPLHREVALSEETGCALGAWGDRPPIIIDESDGSPDSLRLALARGYVGTSHKNCKGVLKGIANACLIEHLRRDQPQGGFIMSGEDLANVGPIALLQDLAVMATLGIEHVERNGHHYFRGLSMWPEDVQAQTLARHGDVYRRHGRGFVTLDIRQGRIEVGSVVDAPLGLGFELDSTRFTPLEQWQFDSLL